MSTYIQVSDGVRIGVIKLEAKLVGVLFFFYCFCIRFSDQEILVAINFDVISLLKRTLNQCGPVVFSKIEKKGTFVSAYH